MDEFLCCINETVWLKHGCSLLSFQHNNNMSLYTEILFCTVIKFISTSVTHKSLRAKFLTISNSFSGTLVDGVCNQFFPHILAMLRNVGPRFYVASIAIFSFVSSRLDILDLQLLAL